MRGPVWGTRISSSSSDEDESSEDESSSSELLEPLVVVVSVLGDFDLASFSSLRPVILGNLGAATGGGGRSFSSFRASILS